MLKLIFSTILIINQSFAISAQRFEGESYIEAYKRHSTKLHKKLRNSTQTAILAAKPYDQLNSSLLTTGWTKDQLTRRFQYLRDISFIDSAAVANQMRRSSWLYPKDGCWLRAELMNRNLERAGLQKASKIFIFGNLEVSSPYSKSGRISWWYHVALIIEIENEKYVLDPAIEAEKSLKLEDWIQRQAKKERVKLSICHPDSFEPGNDCKAPKLQKYSDVIKSQVSYLDKELLNLNEIFGEEKSKEMLTVAPPWK